MSNGFIPIQRNLFNHFLFLEKREYSRFEAWLDLIQMATFNEEQTRLVNGASMITKRGELIASLRYLEERWRWSIGKVRKYLELLRNENMIVVVVENGVNKIRLVNFEKYNPTQSELMLKNKHTKKHTKKHTESIGMIELHKNESTPTNTVKSTEEAQQKHNESTNKNNSNNANNDNKNKSTCTFTDIEIEQYNILNNWISNNTPRVAQLKQQITIKECICLIVMFKNTNDVFKLLQAMDNYKPLTTKYISVYKTMINWAKKDSTLGFVDLRGEGMAAAIKAFRAKLNGQTNQQDVQQNNVPTITVNIHKAVQDLVLNNKAKMNIN